MQNVEMEFVAFDAQDVIATSGDPAATFFKVTSGLFDPEDGWGYAGDKAKWQTDENDFNIYKNVTDNLLGDHYYTITEGASYDCFFSEPFPGAGKSGRLIFDSGLTEGKTGTEVSNLSSILDWLGTNGRQQ